MKKLSLITSKIILMSLILVFCTSFSTSCTESPVDNPTNNENGGENNEDNKNESIDVIETGANLRFTKNTDGTFGFEIEDATSGLIASQPKPAIIRIKDNQGSGRLLQSGYKKVSKSNSAYTGQVTITSSNGSKFSVTDIK